MAVYDDVDSLSSRSRSEALRCKESGEEKVILTALCGHGHLDLSAYEHFLSGEMVDLPLDTEHVADAISKVPVLD